MYNERYINLIVLGDNGVGKTSIIKRIKDGKFQDIYPSTIKTDFFVIKRKYERKNIIIYLDFYDTPGQEALENIIPIDYIYNSHIVLLVFSDIETLNILKKRWYRSYKKNANIDNSIFILIGNKSDTFGDKKEEIIKEGNEFADEIDVLFLTCSAKTDDNMDNLERFIIKEATRFIDDEEKKKKYYSNIVKGENLKEDNYNHKQFTNDDDYNKVSLWQNSKLNKYISF